MVSAARAQYLKPIRGFHSNSFALSVNSLADMGRLPRLRSVVFILTSASAPAPDDSSSIVMGTDEARDGEELLHNRSDIGRNHRRFIVRCRLPTRVTRDCVHRDWRAAETDTHALRAA